MIPLLFFFYQNESWCWRLEAIARYRVTPQVFCHLNNNSQHIFFMSIQPLQKELLSSLLLRLVGQIHFASIFFFFFNKETLLCMICIHNKQQSDFQSCWCKVQPHWTTCHQARIGQLLGAAALLLRKHRLTFSQVFCWCPGWRREGWGGAEGGFKTNLHRTSGRKGMPWQWWTGPRRCLCALKWLPSVLHTDTKLS